MLVCSYNALVWRMVVVYLGASFLLHLAWENAQLPLFESKGLSAWDAFRMCLVATATGDMLFMALIYGAVAVAHARLTWIAERLLYSHPATWVFPMLIGVLLAVSFELWAIYAVERWAYAAAMPLVPVLRVGITPLLQMILIPVGVILLCRHVLDRLNDGRGEGSRLKTD